MRLREKLGVFARSMVAITIMAVLFIKHEREERARCRGT